jgi:hypothetical protein
MEFSTLETDSLKRFAIIALLAAIAVPAWSEPDVRSEAAADVMSRYQEAVRRQQDVMKDVSMEVMMEASIPKLKKHGRLNALRRISTLGKVTYKILGFSGDDTVKKEVMARYMTAEVEAAQNQRDSIGITPENYNFKYKGLNTRANRDVHIFELKPRHKRLGLFKGELWIDPETFLPVREEGRLVKNPSVFIKKMEFARDYEIVDGVAWLAHLESRTDTRIVGRAELHINYTNFHRQETAQEVVDEAHARVVSSH